MDPENVQKYQTYLVFLGYFQGSEQHNLGLGLNIVVLRSKIVKIFTEAVINIVMIKDL